MLPLKRKGMQGNRMLWLMCNVTDWIGIKKVWTPTGNTSKTQRIDLNLRKDMREQNQLPLTVN